MGSQLTPILKTEEIDVDSLDGKVLAVDAYNILYQFLSSLRMYDGSPLKDSSGNVTSHLNGLFLRFTKLMTKGLKFVFVFDGEHPELKKDEVERRKKAKEKAKAKYDEAVQKQDIEEMKKYSSRISTLSPEMVEETRQLLDALGIPYVDAPSEGEAQASYLVRKEDADMVLSQDTDALLFGAENIVRNLTITKKRKKQKSLSYDSVSPIRINLSENLNYLGIDQDQLIALSILVGTDFNYGGIKGIGPKKALKLVKENKDIDSIFKAADDNFEWNEIFYLIKNIPVTDNYNLEFRQPDKEKVIEILCDRHDFNKERVEKELSKITEEKKQRGLNDFF